MGRKKQNPEDSVKRGQILKMAGKMFMDEGYSQVSMDALAHAVPVSKPTLYKYFRDKKALFSAVMQTRCQSKFFELEHILHDGRDARQALTAFARHFLDLVYEPDALNIYRVAITESRQFPELGKLFYETGPRRSIMILAEYLKKTKLPVDDAELAANLFLSMLTNRIHMQCLLGLKKKVSASERSAIAQQAVKIFMDGIT